MSAKKTLVETRPMADAGDASDLIQALIDAQPPPPAAAMEAPRHGVLVGVLHDFDEAGRPRVVVPGHIGAPRVARAICALGPDHPGQQCALLFEQGDLARPLIMGVLQEPVITLHALGAKTITQEAESFTVDAKHAIELRCGKASLRLSSDGRIELRGSTVVSHATGLNRIRGASVKLN
ncbi:MAG TPA: DUF6484 domain-containing protein [Pseudoxanthomonas sp.]|nr:DUF6484 domain-containing protein [Pseudoxanthomonas sp.]